MRKMAIGFAITLSFFSYSSAECEEPTLEFFSRYIVRVEIEIPKPNAKKDAHYTVDGIQHYINDNVLEKSMSVIKMWIFDDAETNISLVESSNISPDGKIDFQNIFIGYSSGETCIEKIVPAKELDDYKRRFTRQCNAKELGEARKILKVGEDAVTKTIEKAREKERGKDVDIST